ncbi:MAG TPA: hypothetical protein VFQ00_10820 [Terriglobales bacterium]|nr:hypothetical protein [Terriglobales bacterium]
MRSAWIALFVISCALAAFSQSAPAGPQLSSADVQKLLDRISSLEQRVSELEAKQAASAAPAEQNATPAAAPVEQAQAAPVQQQQPPSIPVPPNSPATIENKTAKAPPTAETDVMAGMHTIYQPGEGEPYPNLKIRGFADIDFGANSSDRVNSGFTLGQFVLHFASALSPKISYFAEVSLTPTAGVYNVDLERTIIRYDVNDAAKISFGRYHTPINYWNTAFHHGAWLQTTIARPDMIVFGGRFIPVHFVGAQSEGFIPSGSLGLGYNLGIGNGRSTNIARPGDPGDVNNNRAWLANVFLRPPALKHFQIGGSVYNDEITMPTVDVGPQGQNFREWISSAHLVWTGETPEFYAEFANVHHRSIFTGQTFDSQGGYVQFAYRLPFNQRKWKPYYRYDYLQVPFDEPTLLDFTNVRKSTLGVRYDISDFAAFKAEYRNGRGNPLPQRTNAVAVQTAFTF